MPRLIFCAGGNRRFAALALEAGWEYGAQLPATLYFSPLVFADQDWKRPDRVRYLAALREHRPEMATVLDWERDEQLPEVLGWAEDAAPYVERLIVIPKVVNETHRIPTHIGGREVVLGLSVPTRYGGTSVPLWEFTGRKVHLLGGSPQRQMREYLQLGAAQVVSADGNMAQRLAVTHCAAWKPSGRGMGHWLSLGTDDTDAPYLAFARSCAAIRAAWERIFS